MIGSEKTFVQSSDAPVTYKCEARCNTEPGWSSDAAKTQMIDQMQRSEKGLQMAKDAGIPVYQTIAEALTGGTKSLAVDGVMLIAEHGDYPESDTGQFVFPKRRMFEEIANVMRQNRRSVPVFLDKHLADNWADAKWIYDTAKELKIPMMAGSSLPVLWRYPPRDVTRDAKLKEIVAISYHRLDTYGFHALEMVQCLAERRQGGETGVKTVQCRQGQAVWDAEKDGVYDRALLEAALSRLKERPLPKGKRIEDRSLWLNLPTLAMVTSLGCRPDLGVLFPGTLQFLQGGLSYLLL